MRLRQPPLSSGVRRFPNSPSRGIRVIKSIVAATLLSLTACSQSVSSTANTHLALANPTKQNSKHNTQRNGVRTLASVEENIVAYLRLEFGEDEGDAETIEVSDLKYIGEIEKDGIVTRYWSFPSTPPTWATVEFNGKRRTFGMTTEPPLALVHTNTPHQ